MSIRKFLVVLLLTFTAATNLLAVPKEPIVIEAVTKYHTIEETLYACKGMLLGEKFIAREIQKKGFTATRTTSAKADYFVADVTAVEEANKVKITITFVKVGTGLLNLNKVAERIKAKLEE